MSATLTVYDETATGVKSGGFTLDFLTERITVRELIRERVYEEVRQYNAASPEYFRGLVQPTDAEATLNGYRVRDRRRKIDWEKQFDMALKAFEKNGFFILVDDKQVESLEETIEVRPGTQVSFIRLVPLVGG
ncbi:MAG TPA: hypothetical protein VM490_19020 [Armatimonadaceae bacterium]|jgi:hypothetical protein|nr:hypothetical protein [Armatimonadaceae bacterium]